MFKILLKLTLLVLVTTSFAHANLEDEITTLIQECRAGIIFSYFKYVKPQEDGYFKPNVVLDGNFKNHEACELARKKIPDAFRPSEASNHSRCTEVYRGPQKAIDVYAIKVKEIKEFPGMPRDPQMLYFRSMEKCKITTSQKFKTRHYGSYEYYVHLNKPADIHSAGFGDHYISKPCFKHNYVFCKDGGQAVIPSPDWIN